MRVRAWQVYVADIGLEDSDTRVNIGERMLAALFSNWLEAQQAGQPPAEPPKEPPLPSLRFRPLEQVRVLVSQQGVPLLKGNASELHRASAQQESERARTGREREERRGGRTERAGARAPCRRARA